ncbi:hypothetical protein C8R45DRAFT_135928 [Mycena sanguinolenta]|nr:hypothetical protein C8R45DRAFT_135928 [Mycena sanguinolenta]
MRLLLAPLMLTLAPLFGAHAAPVPVVVDLSARLDSIPPRPKVDDFMRRVDPSTPDETVTVPSLSALSGRVYSLTSSSLSSPTSRLSLNLARDGSLLRSARAAADCTCVCSSCRWCLPRPVSSRLQFRLPYIDSTLQHHHQHRRSQPIKPSTSPHPRMFLCFVNLFLG